MIALREAIMTVGMVISARTSPPTSGADRGKDMKLAGIVTTAEHRVSKNGKPFGSLTIEDYFDSHRIMLFGEDYVKYKHYLENGMILYVKGSIQERRWGNEGELEFKVSGIELLSEVREKSTDPITLKFELKSLDERLVGELEDLIKGNKGNTRVKLNVIDREEQIALDLPAAVNKIDVTPELIERLDKMPELVYEVNR